MGTYITSINQSIIVGVASSIGRAVERSRAGVCRATEDEPT